MEGAQTTIHCAVEESLEEVSGVYFADCKPAEESKLAKDDAFARTLWEETAKLCGLDSK